MRLEGNREKTARELRRSEVRASNSGHGHELASALVTDHLLRRRTSTVTC